MANQVTAYEVAAFTTQKSAGSPTGVVMDARNVNGSQMQQIARQLGYTHTAFISRAVQVDYDVDIRFFTPLREIPNCGHATIAAHFLRERQSERSGNRLVTQKTALGVQTVEIRQRDAALRPFFKQNPISFSEVSGETVGELCAALGLPSAALDERFPVMLASPGANRFLAPVMGFPTLKSLRPDFAKLKALCARHESIGCFAFALENNDVTARMFAPMIGVDEDIINGNSSGCLGAYLLGDKSHTDLCVNQGFAFERPGAVFVEAHRNGDKVEAIIGGDATLAQEIIIHLD